MCQITCFSASIFFGAALGIPPTLITTLRTCGSIAKGRKGAKIAGVFAWGQHDKIEPMSSSLRTLVVVTLLLISVPVLAAAPQNKAASPKKPLSQKKADFSPVRFLNPATMAKPVSTYSQVVEVTGGKTVYIAGQVALDTSGTLVGPNDFRAQVKQVFKNIKAAVESAGGDMNSLVKVNYYCAESVDPTQLPALREVRDQYINTANPPASTFVVVKRLARLEYLLEVEAVAVIPQK
jgi:enamine deaminase RidA (YjgF/YER057c/UK114 family)